MTVNGQDDRLMTRPRSAKHRQPTNTERFLRRPQTTHQGLTGSPFLNVPFHKRSPSSAYNMPRP